MPDNHADLLEVLNQQSIVVDELIELGLAETDAFKIDGLVDRSRRLQKINETNRLLARMSLSFNRMMQKALGIAANGGYDQKGMPAAPQGYLGRLDASA
ncbi:MAG: hypothetical protein ABSA82_06150 [Thermacetogeniaceae bacterium]